jgi:hypothetical protein
MPPHAERVGRATSPVRESGGPRAAAEAEALAGIRVATRHRGLRGSSTGDQMNEGLRYVRWKWVVLGWFLAIALASLILLALLAAGILTAEEEPGDALWIAQALLTAFFLSGFLVGGRVVVAPVLHGVGMAGFSVVAWIAVNLVLGAPTGATTWRSLDLLTLTGLLLIQAAAAVVGARLGSRWVRSPPRRA